MHNYNFFFDVQCINCFMHPLQLSGDYDKARDLYKASMQQSKAMGLESIAGYAQEELQVLDSESHDKSEDKTA